MSRSPRHLGALVAAWFAVALSMLVLDLLFLGIVARGYYDEALGSLRSPETHWPAALAFYGMYVSFVVGVAVWPARSARQALQRGAGMGFFAYATYELTNWAVIADWPSSLVLLDIVWGVVLTGGVALFGYLGMRTLRPLAAPLALVLILGVSACAGGSEPPGSHQSGSTDGGERLPEADGWRTFALEQVSSQIVTNPSPFSSDTAVSSISAWLRVRWQRVGTEVVWDEALCTMRSNQVFGTTTHYPAPFLESVPLRRRTGTIAEPVVGASFEAGPFVDLYGAELSEPATDALPIRADDPWVEDTDGDGEPGITVHIEQSLLGEGDVFVAQRSTTRLEGLVLSPDRIEGQAWVDTEQNVLGATAGWLESGTASVPDPEASHNYFIFQAVPDHTTCFEIVLQRDRIFGGV